MKNRLLLFLAIVCTAIPSQALTVRLSGHTPCVVTLEAGQTVAQCLAARQADITAGTITGDLAGVGKDEIVGVFDNADLGLTTLEGVALADNAVFLEVYQPGDLNLDRKVNSDDYNMLVAGFFQNWTNGPNDALGMATKGATITWADWLIFRLAYLLYQATAH